MAIQSGEDGWWRFLKLCHQLKTEKQLDGLFDLFLTIEERRAVTDRCKIITELLKGEKTQREIAAHHRVGIATITRGSNYLKTINDDLRKFLESKLL